MKEQNSNTGSEKGLPFVLPVEQWGEIAEASEECPGVYYAVPCLGEESPRPLHDRRKGLDSQPLSS